MMTLAWLIVILFAFYTLLVCFVDIRAIRGLERLFFEVTRPIGAAYAGMRKFCNHISTWPKAKETNG